MPQMLFYFPRVDSIRDEPRMVGGERQRAYRYGMTLLCVGALFNWLGLSDSGNSEPIRFIAYTCLASGALLICMAICFWANSGSSPHRPRHMRGSSGLTNAQRDMVVSIVENSRAQREKPPDYSAVADLSPPPSYDDAIRLSPAYLIPATSGMVSSMGERAPEYSVSCSVVNELEPPTLQQQHVEETPRQAGPPRHPQQAPPPPPSPPAHLVEGQEPPGVEDKPNPDSPLSRVIRLSSRFLRRTLSNVDRRGDEEEPETPSIRRSSSFQDLKNT